MRNRFSDNIFYGGAMFLDRCTGILVLPLLTKNLSPIEYGIWSQTLVYFGFASVLLLFGFYHTISVIRSSISSQQSSILYLLITSLFFILSLILTGLIIFFPSEAASFLYSDGGLHKLLFYATAFVISETLYELVILGFIRSEDMIKRVSYFHTFKSIGRLLCIFLAVNLENILLSIMLLNIILNIIICIWGYYIILDFRTVKKKNLLPNSILIYNLKFSLITNLSVFIGYLILMGNRFLILHLEGIEANALFSAHYAVISLIGFIPMVLQFTLLHHISSDFATNKDQSIKTTLEWSVHVYFLATIPISIILYIYYLPISNILISNIYQTSSSFLIGLIIFFIILGFEQIVVYAAIATKDKFLWIARIIGAFFQVILALFFLKLTGLSSLPYILSLSSLIVCFWACIHLKGIISIYEFCNYVGYFLIPSSLTILIGTFAANYIPGKNFVEVLFGSLLILVSFLVIEALRPSKKSHKVLTGIF